MALAKHLFWNFIYLSSNFFHGQENFGFGKRNIIMEENVHLGWKQTPCAAYSPTAPLKAWECPKIGYIILWKNTFFDIVHFYFIYRKYTLWKREVHLQLEQE